VNLATSYRITHYLELTARVDNLLNQHYEEVAGFGTAGISLYGGLKLTF
jgi:vitamin B12 transporter